jgi:hypothetical protein
MARLHTRQLAAVTLKMGKAAGNLNATSLAKGASGATKDSLQK